MVDRSWSSLSILTREILDILEILESSTEFDNLICIETIGKGTNSENKGYRRSANSKIRTFEQLTIERCKSCTCSDEALTPWSILKREVSERDHTTQSTSNVSITDQRTSASISDTLNEESKGGKLRI